MKSRLNNFYLIYTINLIGWIEKSWSNILFQLNLTDIYRIIEMQEISILILTPEKKEKDQKEIEENSINQEKIEGENTSNSSISTTDALVKY